MERINKYKLQKENAWFLIVLLLLANFSFAIFISKQINGAVTTTPVPVITVTPVPVETVTPVITIDLTETSVSAVTHVSGGIETNTLEGITYTTSVATGELIGATVGKEFMSAAKVQAGKFLKKSLEILDKTFNAYSIAKAITVTKELTLGEFGSCSSERKLSGTANCEKCNDDPFVPCTDARCRLLGSCTPGNSKDEQGKSITVCVPGECDGGLVVVDKIRAEWVDPAHETKKLSKEGNKRLEISDKFAYNVNDINLSITTNIYSMCKYGIDGEGKDKEYKEMYNFEEVVWSKYHQALIELPDSVIRGQKHRVYVKCESICGDVHDAKLNDYYAEFEFEELPDTLAPSISFVDPDETYFYSSEIENVEITVSLSENGKCRYSTKEADVNLSYATDWGSMNEFSECRNNQPCVTRDEKKCSECSFTLDLNDDSLAEEIDWGSADYSNLNIADEVQAQMELTGITKTYQLNIICQDQDANRMEEAYEYVFKTAEPYTLAISEPVGEVDERNIPITLNTSRSTKCRLSIDTELSFDDMRKLGEIFDVSHKVELTNLSAGKHTVYVKCLDSVNLMASNSRAFSVRGDTMPPKVTRAYRTSSFEPLLTIKTDEEAQCKYSTDKDRKCNFNIDAGEEEGVFGMMSVDSESKEHTAMWDSSKTYYIRCKDWKGITPSAGQCAQNGIIQPYSLVETSYW